MERGRASVRATSGLGARSGWLRALLAALAVVTGVARVEAYPQYNDGAGNGCVSCHDEFTVAGGSQLHVDHLTKFNITSCTLCHQNTGGQKPVLTYWSSDGFGCSGCHGMDYGESTPTNVLDPDTNTMVPLLHGGQPKSTAYGLRAKHALEFAAMDPPQPDLCAGCHYPGSPYTGDPDPAPAIFPETTRPPYYNRPTNNLTDPCSSEQESFESVFPGLDNDGNGFPDMTDSACAAFVTTTTITPTTTTTTTTIGGTARHITVYPGQSIQNAVDALASGGTLYVMPGTYQEPHFGTNAVTIRKNGIRLIARSNPKKGQKVILQPNPNRDHRNGIVVEGTANARIDGFKVKGFTIQGFPNNGILTSYVDNFRIERNESIENLENGIWPTLSANGLVKKNVAYGSEDSALWVEASENVRVIGNELYNSPTGLEITVSNNIVAKKNDVHDNTTGIGLYNYRGAGLPPLAPADRNGNWDIVNNHVHDNNMPNAVEGGLVGLLPPGGGILLTGVDHVNIRGNQIENNDFYGIAVVDWCIAVGCPSVPPGDPPALNGVPENNTFVNNTLTNNGTDPQTGGDPLLGVFATVAADITYVVADSDPPQAANCFSGNAYETLKSLFPPTPTQSKK